jgi:hypothetical protein
MGTQYIVSANDQSLKSTQAMRTFYPIFDVAEFLKCNIGDSQEFSILAANLVINFCTSCVTVERK